VTIPIDWQRTAYHYELDPARIAQRPVVPRDAARLLVHDRASGATSHERFSDLPRFLHTGDLLVINTTRVLPARLFPRRADTGAAVQVLLLRARTPSLWEALVRPGRRLRPGAELRWEDGTAATVVERLPDGARLVSFSRPVELAWLRTMGAMPLPPYIRRAATSEDAEQYQTVYASEPGAVAAPTAGLHFTPELLERLEAMGVRRAEVVLHVGTGTFRPVRVDDIREHAMHREHYQVPAETLDALRRTRADGGRIIAVGTTSVRTLETIAANGQADAREPVSDWTDIFIYPPHTFRLTDTMITNLHLPESTLLMLVAAFAGRDHILALYREAAARSYRFYSYGDAMLLV